MKGLWGHHSHGQIVGWKHHLHGRSLCGQNFTITIDTHTHTKQCTKLGLRLLPEWFLGVRYLRYFRTFFAFLFLQTGMAWYVWMLTIRAALQTRKSFERSTKRRYKARGCYSVHFFIICSCLYVLQLLLIRFTQGNLCCISPIVGNPNSNFSRGIRIWIVSICESQRKVLSFVIGVEMQKLWESILFGLYNIKKMYNSGITL